MITKVKPDTILNNVWPAIILANSRIDKLKDLNMYFKKSWIYVLQEIGRHTAKPAEEGRVVK